MTAHVEWRHETLEELALECARARARVCVFAAVCQEGGRMSVTLGEKGEMRVFLHNALVYGGAVYGSLCRCLRQESGPVCARACV